MISLAEIEKFYPPNQAVFKRNILREYFQIKILQAIYDSEYSSKVSFLGGTCLRIVFGTNRFSEDLDFDNFGLTLNEFELMVNKVGDLLREEGYYVEIKTVHKGAFRCYLRMPGVLFDNRLSGYQEEKILIQIDTEVQNIEYKPVAFIANKFDLIFRLFYTPVDILLAQKVWAILNRKVVKGRDLYDSAFLFGMTKPDYNYLSIKAGIENLEMLKKRLLERLEAIDIVQLQNDVSPFLIHANEIKRIELFPEIIKALK